MTLGQAKAQVLKLLDEAKPKSDLTDKLNQFFDMGQKEVALYAPIWKEKTYASTDAKTLPTDCRKAVHVIVDSVWYPYSVTESLPDAFVLRYQAYPNTIADDAAETVSFEVSEESAYAIVLYAAAQCNSLEYDQRFFQSFYAQYQNKLSNLAAVDKSPAALVVSGYDI